MFDTLTIRPQPRKLGMAAPAAAAIHAAVIAGVIAASLWNTGEIGLPLIPVSIFIPIHDPPPPPPTGDGRGNADHIRPGPSKAFQPTRLPPSPEAAGPPPTAAGPSPGETSPVEAANGNGGAVDGIPGGTGVSSEGTVVGDEPIAVNTPHVVAPRILFQPQPDYPDVSRIGREQGVVILQAVIGLDGRVENVSLLHSASPRLDAAAARAVAQWRYSPATLDQHAVRVFLTATVRFTLR